MKKYLLCRLLKNKWGSLCMKMQIPPLYIFDGSEIENGHIASDAVNRHMSLLKIALTFSS